MQINILGPEVFVEREGSRIEDKEVETRSSFLRDREEEENMLRIKQCLLGWTEEGKRRVTMTVNAQGNLQYLAERCFGVKYSSAFQSHRKGGQ